uniref:Abnormal GONad development family member (Gon-4) n=1 Tax=Sphingobacterium sp. (strain 21) TaxID=743722 RepID=F4C510_SPHS2
MKKKKDKIVTVDRYSKYADIDEMYSTKYSNIKLTIPSNLRMLCAIFEVKVEDLLYDFMWNTRQDDISVLEKY